MKQLSSLQWLSWAPEHPDAALQTVMRSLSDVRIAFGQSDEYSFVLHKSTQLYGEHLVIRVISCFTHSAPLHTASLAFKQEGGGQRSCPWCGPLCTRWCCLTALLPLLTGRRSSKLLSIVVSTFTAAFVDGWDRFLPGLKRQALPVFDGRTVCYPSEQSLKDYLAWRQSDAHINNQVGLGCDCKPPSSTSLQALQDCAALTDHLRSACYPHAFPCCSITHVSGCLFTGMADPLLMPSSS